MAEKNTEKITLYSYWKSSSAWRVRIVLNLKKVDFDLKIVKLSPDDGDQLSASFQTINPMGRVPALDVDGNVIVESFAIMEYLNELYPNPPLLPADLLTRAKVRSICQIIICGIQPLQNSTSVLSTIEPEKRQDWAKHWIVKGFTALEKILRDESGRFCVGYDVTLADCCLAPQVFNAKGFKVDLEPFPHIVRIAKELENIPEFRAAHPFHQPDCPMEFKENN